MSHPNNKSVQLTFRYTEDEYIAAMRFYLLRSREVLARLVIGYGLFAGGLVVLNVLLEFTLPVWSIVAFILLAGVSWVYSYLVDVPRRFFRSEPKFREEYTLTFTDAGIDLKTQGISASIAWTYYTGMLENGRFYFLTYGQNIHAPSIFPKRAFRDSEQETIFREMLRRNVDQALKVRDGDEPGYVPSSSGPPDWR